MIRSYRQLDMQELEILNLTLEKLDVDPATPGEGRVWFSNGSNLPKIRAGGQNRFLVAPDDDFNNTLPLKETLYINDTLLIYDIENTEYRRIKASVILDQMSTVKDVFKTLHSEYGSTNIIATGADEIYFTADGDLLKTVGNDIGSKSIKYDLNDQAINSVFAGPLDVISGRPTFRHLTDGDLPSSYNPAKWNAAGDVAEDPYIIEVSSDILSSSVIDSVLTTVAWSVGNKDDGRLYWGATNPTGTKRLNYDGYFYATKLFTNGVEVIGGSLWEDVSGVLYTVNRSQTVVIYETSFGNGVISVNNDFAFYANSGHNLSFHATGGIININPGQNTNHSFINIGSSDVDTVDITIQAQSYNANADIIILPKGSGNLYLNGGVYFGNGSAGVLLAKSTETNVVYYDPATGFLTYGVPTGGGGVTITGATSGSQIAVITGPDTLSGDDYFSYADNTLFVTSVQASTIIAYLDMDNVNVTDPYSNTISKDTVNRMKLFPAVADYSSPVAYMFDTFVSLTVSGTKLFSIRNHGVEKFYIDKDGEVYANGVHLGAGGGGGGGTDTESIDLTTGALVYGAGSESELALGNPGTDGFLLSSTIAGVRSWIAPPSSMIYPDAGIPVSTGSAWDTSITDDSADWNSAYGWGDHAGLYSILAHDHTGTYEPVLGNPGFDGYVLSSTAAGARSWIEMPVNWELSLSNPGVDGYILSSTAAGARSWIAPVAAGEPLLGNPGTDGFLLSSTIAGVRSWVATPSHTHGNITNAGKIGTTAYLPVMTSTGGLLNTGVFGTYPGTFCAGDDSRLSNARTPTAHNLIDATMHPVSGLTAGHVMKALTATTYGFATLAPADISAEPALGNPAADGYVLVSTAAGARSWYDMTNFYTILNGGVPVMKLDPGVADDGYGQAYLFDTINDMATPGQKILMVRTAGVEKFFVDKDGAATIGGRVMTESSDEIEFALIKSYMI